VNILWKLFSGIGWISSLGEFTPLAFFLFYILFRSYAQMLELLSLVIGCDLTRFDISLSGRVELKPKQSYRVRIHTHEDLIAIYILR
jgi:hypothetical protein